MRLAAAREGHPVGRDLDNAVAGELVARLHDEPLLGSPEDGHRRITLDDPREPNGFLWPAGITVEAAAYCKHAWKMGLSLGCDRIKHTLTARIIPNNALVFAGDRNVCRSMALTGSDIR